MLFFLLRPFFVLRPSLKHDLEYLCYTILNNSYMIKYIILKCKKMFISSEQSTIPSSKINKGYSIKKRGGGGDLSTPFGQNWDFFLPPRTKMGIFLPLRTKIRIFLPPWTKWWFPPHPSILFNGIALTFLTLQTPDELHGCHDVM